MPSQAVNNIKSQEMGCDGGVMGSLLVRHAISHPIMVATAIMSLSPKVVGPNQAKF